MEQFSKKNPNQDALRVDSGSTSGPAERSVELQCGRCGSTVYHATKSEFDSKALRAAVDAHEQVCPTGSDAKSQNSGEN
ncbi:MAG TPA: hypothetical protein VLV18_07905 [Terriglobales bacterium]|nr:hypothetical protein [Terriglobales bacterium]